MAMHLPSRAHQSVVALVENQGQVIYYNAEESGE